MYIHTYIWGAVLICFRSTVSSKSPFKLICISRLCFQHLCLPFRPLPYLTWPVTCGNSTVLNDPTLPRLPPARFCPFGSRAHDYHFIQSSFRNCHSSLCLFPFKDSMYVICIYIYIYIIYTCIICIHIYIIEREA